jgi:hypothetical protein
MSLQLNGDTGVTFNDTSLQGSAASPYVLKNRIINGDMRIDQRNAGASVTPTSSAYTLDRWSATITQASKLSIQQNAGSVTPPVGFKNYLGATSLSAYSVSASDYFLLYQGIEGFNIADLGWGTASAKTVTLSFQVYSSLTGTFGGSLTNAGFNRSYPFTYSVSSANTWTTVSVTIAGDTSGTWATDNTQGIRLYFGLGVGSTNSGTAGAWAGAQYLSATGATSVVGTNGATFYITGVQLEVGINATSFDYRPYGTELALCQRYFESCFSIGTAPAAGVAAGRFRFLNMSATQTNDVTNNLFFAVSKRAVPTMTQYASTGNTVTAAFDNFGTEGGNMFATLGANASSFSHWTASAEL